MFPRLSVLDTVACRIGTDYAPLLEKTILVCGQHVISTTGSLFETLFSCGARPDRTFVLGKIYSTHAETLRRLEDLGVTVYPGSAPLEPGQHGTALRSDVDRLWREVLDRWGSSRPGIVVVVDDGTGLSQRVPSPFLQQWKMISVEQTTFGHRKPRPFPVIQVAASAVKTHIEPRLIAEVILAKARPYLPPPPSADSVGVVGLGRIGRAVAKALAESAFKVVVFDKNVSLRGSIRNAIPVHSAEALLRSCGFVFGCTGSDWLRCGGDLSAGLDSDKVFVSCSSSDVEFRSALRNWTADLRSEGSGLCPDLVLTLHGGRPRIRVPRSGFPINFDNSPSSVEASKIQITRALLLGGVLQGVALSCETIASESFALEPAIQRFCVLQWQEDTELLGADEVARFSNPEWIASESDGLSAPVPDLTSKFR